MTPANCITFGRLILSPVVLILFCFGNETVRIVGLIIFALAAISDFWDGYIARKTRVSYWGKLWDPIADKFLSGFALITLSILGMLPWWITIPLVIRDIVVTIARLIKLRHGAGIILPVLTAKLKTTLELIMLVALFAWSAFFGKTLPLPAQIGVVIYASIVVILSLATGVHYIRVALRK